MKIRGYVIVLLAAAALFVAGYASGKGNISPGTEKNLSTAMKGEAFAYAKYSLYASEARKNGNIKLADLFEKSAHTERFEHFAEEARLSGLVKSDAENLKDAISGESYEVETMYAEFAKEATAAGDHKVARQFEEIRADEMKHRDAFKAALTEVETKTTAQK